MKIEQFDSILNPLHFIPLKYVILFFSRFHRGYGMHGYDHGAYGYGHFRHGSRGDHHSSSDEDDEVHHRHHRQRQDRNHHEESTEESTEEEEHEEHDDHHDDRVWRFQVGDNTGGYEYMQVWHFFICMLHRQWP